MEILIFNNKKKLGQAAGETAARVIRKAIRRRGAANLILATGVSQFDTLQTLVSSKNINWAKVTLFHLDEYIGLSDTHPASFRNYLFNRFVKRVPPLRAVHFINGDAKDPREECRRLSKTIRNHPIDVALAGIGENAHLAFNDPPADFKTSVPYLIVKLDRACRKQQLGEGWFKSLDRVPRRAISMSISFLMKSRLLIVSVPDQRKAEAVRKTVEGPVSPSAPASILQKHPHCKLYLDHASASLTKAIKRLKK